MSAPPTLRIVTADDAFAESSEAASPDVPTDDDFAHLDPQEPTLDALLAQEAEAAARAVVEAAPPDGDVVPLDTIQVRPEDNVSRGGTMDGPTHPRVLLLAASMTSPDCGRLLEGLGLEALPAPVPRPCGPYGHQPGQRPCCPPGAVGTHTLRLRYGFRRIVALRLAGLLTLHRSRGNVVIHTDATKRQLDAMGGIENMLRDDPTHLQLAEFCVLTTTAHGMTVDEIVAATGVRAPTIESYMMMVKRLPPDLLQVWRLRETSEVERALAKIAAIDLDHRIHLDDTAARHAQMRAAWALVEATWAQEAAARAAAAAAVPPAKDKLSATSGQAGYISRHTVKKRLRALLAEVDRAREVWDSAGGGWRPLDDRERRLLQDAFVHLSAPSDTPFFQR